MIPFLINYSPKKRRTRRKRNPSHLAIVNPWRRKSANRKGRANMAARRRRKKRANPIGGRRRRSSRRRRNQYSFARGVVTNPRRRRSRRRFSRNPLVKGKALEQILLVGAGFLVAPMVSALIPFTPSSKLGEYLKKAAAVTVGATIVNQVLGKRYGNALLLGGMISVGVDVIREFVPAFGGMGAYFPPDSELAAMTANGNGMAATGLLPDPGGVPNRWASRWTGPAGVAVC